MSCLCTETWQKLPLCQHESEVDQRYAYGLWVHPDCEQHYAHLTETQNWIKEVRSDGPLD